MRNLREFLKVIPILIGVVVGYITACFMGLVDLGSIGSASFFTVPQIKIAKFDITAILTILPATFVVIAEYIGHLKVTSNIVGKDLSKDPGFHRSLLKDGLSTMISAIFGSVPKTTYGENIGVMALTKVYSVYVILVLFGIIATSVFRTFIESKVDFSKSRNLILTSVIFMVGLSGIKLSIGIVELTGMGLAKLPAHFTIK